MCALECSPAPPPPPPHPESADQMSYTSAEFNPVAGTPCLLVLPGLPGAFTQLGRQKRQAVPFSQAFQQKGEGNSIYRGLALSSRQFISGLPHLTPQEL